MFAAIPDKAPIAAVVGAGMMSGLFFGFSTRVMTSLARQPETSGMMMQEIKRSIVNPAFGLVLAGTALCSAVVIVLQVRRGPGETGAVALAAGAG